MNYRLVDLDINDIIFNHKAALLIFLLYIGLVYE